MVFELFWFDFHGSSMASNQLVSTWFWLAHVWIAAKYACSLATVLSWLDCWPLTTSLKLTPCEGQPVSPIKTSIFGFSARAAARIALILRLDLRRPLRRRLGRLVRRVQVQHDEVDAFHQVLQRDKVRRARVR